MSLGVYCECGVCCAVEEEDAGHSVICPCGRTVVVPLLDEFRERPHLLSAATLERRIRRLLAEGELPDTDACRGCGNEDARIVKVVAACERRSVHTSGGPSFLFIPLPWGFLWATMREETRVELRGRNTDIPTPISLCPACHRGLRRPSRPLDGLALGLLLLAVIVLIFVVFNGYPLFLIGIGAAVVGMILVPWRRSRAWKRWDEAVKGLLRKVPVYRQVLEDYPHATIIIPQRKSR
jgi:hypothetical protein